MTKYRVDGKATVPYALFIEANSAEEATNLAEQAHIGPEESDWGMSVDEYDIEVDSVQPINPCMRPFIPNFDD